MNRAAVNYYPFQVFSRFMINHPKDVFYIGGNDILPAPLVSEQEAAVISPLEQNGNRRQKQF